MRKLYQVAPAFLLAAQPVVAAEYPPAPYLIDFETGSSTVSKVAQAKLLATAAAQAEWPEYDIFICTFAQDERVALERSEKLVSLLQQQPARYVQIDSVETCPSTTKSWVDGVITQNSAFVALLSERDIFELTQARLFSRANYVPDSGWLDDNKDGVDSDSLFYEDWFGDQLAAMNEPSFRSTDQLQIFKSRFRFTVYPNALPAYTIRIDQRAEGEFVIAWTLLEGAGGDAPGAILKQSGRRLSPAEAIRFQKLLTAADLPAKPMEEKQPTSGQNDGALLVCIHGTHWTFEELSKSGSYFLERSFCGYRDAELDALVEFGMNLTDGELRAEMKKIEVQRFGQD